MLFRSSSSGSQQEETLSTEDGHYQLYERAGDYFLYAQGNNEHGDSFSTSQAVDLQDDEARTVDLELFKAADMEVVVFNDSYQSTIDIGSVKVEALDHGGLDFSKSTSEEGSFSIVLPAGNYRFTGSDQQTVDERKVEYKLDDTILIGNISQDMILYVEAEKNQRFGIMVDFPEPSSHNVYRDAEKEFEVLVTNIGNETQSVELSVNFDGLLSNYANVSLSEEVFDLRAGDNKTITVTVSLDDSAPLNYRDEIVVTSIVDEDSAIEVEDSLYVVVKRSRLSDIRVKEMTIEDRPRLKENYLIEVVIENLNPYSVAENFNVEFRVAGEVVATEENVTIPSGSNTTTVSIEVEAGKTGDALVRVILDSADTVDETNEENNEATQNINIWPTERVEDIDEGVPMYQRVIMIVVAAICLAIVTVTFINRKKK